MTLKGASCYNKNDDSSWNAPPSEENAIPITSKNQSILKDNILNGNNQKFT